MQQRIKQAVILSAGFGTRLRPLTDTMPKVMVPILGKPMLEHHILRLKKHGVTEVFINLHYLPDVVRSYFGSGTAWGIKIIYALEDPIILGTAGGIKNFEDMLDEEFFVIYGDVFSLVDYSKMAEAFAARPDAIAMGIVGETDHPHDSDLVTTDNNLRFLQIYPKPNKEIPAEYTSMRALYIMNKRILKYVPKNTYYEIDHQLLPAVLAQGGVVYGYKTTDFHKDAGTMERYEQVKAYIEDLAAKGMYAI